MKKIKYPHAGTIEVAPGKSNLELFKHQNDAIKNLNDKILFNKNKSFAGLLVLPTGAGKTLTATYWLLKNYTDKSKKILWIAHRHELLEQAKNSFKQLAYSDILKNRSSFNYRIISGLHDKPVNIDPNDDIIISSKDSLNQGFEYLYENWIKQNTQDIFLVIDEAHHATAKTYRKLIDNLRNYLNKENITTFRMLGLTATPYRTAESEKGLLKKVFPDDIIYKIDLRTLINRGILSEPLFKEVQTTFDMTKYLDEKDLDNIQYFDIERIGKAAALTIANNSERNHTIVNHYLENKSTYNQTIVFALNIDNAIALNSLFNKKNIKSDYVVSSIKDAATGVSISNKENKRKIDLFRNGDLKVLVNVNILTEGTDLPEVQTVFLARPTISSILMTQMVGRGLRGKEAGGTKTAYIVGFIDEWKDKVKFVNPEQLFIEENASFNDKKRDKDKKILRLVSILKLEEFASIMDRSIDTDELESLEFIERIPIGLYSFTLLESVDGEERDRNCEILVYDNIKRSYEDFINYLPDFFKDNNISEQDSFKEEELSVLRNKIEDSFFYGCEKYPGYVPKDIEDILLFYAQKEIQPQFIALKDRGKYDLTKLANYIIENDLGPKAKKEFLEEMWEKKESQWKVFFGFDKKYFLNEVDLIQRRIEFPELFKKNKDEPIDIKEKRHLEKLSMSELRERCPEYWKKLSDEVYDKFKDKDGYYFSAKSGFKSKNKLKFQIDHIKPLSKGGLTKLDNLQLLTQKENREKGNKTESNKNYQPKEVNNSKKEIETPKTKNLHKNIKKSIEKINRQKKIPSEYIKLWKKYKRSPGRLTNDELDKLAVYIKKFGYI